MADHHWYCFFTLDIKFEVGKTYRAKVLHRDQNRLSATLRIRRAPELHFSVSDGATTAGAFSTVLTKSA
jgi:hypothetical protein